MKRHLRQKRISTFDCSPMKWRVSISIDDIYFFIFDQVLNSIDAQFSISWNDSLSLITDRRLFAEANALKTMETNSFPRRKPRNLTSFYCIKDFVRRVIFGTCAVSSKRKILTLSLLFEV